MTPASGTSTTNAFAASAVAATVAIASAGASSASSLGGASSAVSAFLASLGVTTAYTLIPVDPSATAGGPINKHIAVLTLPVNYFPLTQPVNYVSTDKNTDLFVQ